MFKSQRYRFKSQRLRFSSQRYRFRSQRYRFRSQRYRFRSTTCTMTRLPVEYDTSMTKWPDNYKVTQALRLLTLNRQNDVSLTLNVSDLQNDTSSAKWRERYILISKIYKHARAIHLQLISQRNGEIATF